MKEENLYKKTGKQFHLLKDRFIVYGTHTVTDDFISAEFHRAKGYEVLRVGNCWYIGEKPLKNPTTSAQ